MRLSLRFIIPLLLVLTAFTYAVLPLIDDLTVRWFVRDLDIRASLIANTVQPAVEESVQSGDSAGIRAILTAITKDERVYGAGFCALPDASILAAGTLPADLGCGNLASFSGPSAVTLPSVRDALLVSVRRLEPDGTVLGDLVLVHDMSFVEPPQRGDPALRVLSLRRARRSGVAVDGRHCAVELARLGPGHARAASRRRPPASIAAGRTSPEFRPTGARPPRADSRHRIRAAAARR